MNMKRELPLRRLRPLWVALVLLCMGWLVAWWEVPVWLKDFVQEQGRAALGREVQVDAVSFRPWSLELELKGLRVAGATPNAPALLEVARIYADAELQSVVRLAPVIDALQVEQPVLRVRHLGEGRYDVDDLIARWSERPRGGETPSFGLFNLSLTGGELQLDDAPAKAVHQLRDLAVSVPFLSNLPTQRNVRTEPRMAFELNGSRFDTQLSTLPFTDTLSTRAHLSLPDLDLTPYLPYWPQALPWRPVQARVMADVTLGFEQGPTPVVQLAGTLAVKQLRVAQAGGAQPLLSWDDLSVVLADSRPLARQVHVQQLRLQAPTVHVARDAQGHINLAGLLPTASAASVAEPTHPRPAWDVKLDRFELTEGVVRWRDATLAPAWESQLESIELSADALAWPTRATSPVSGSARWAGAVVQVKGEVGMDQAELDLSWRDLALGGLAPYLSQVLTQPLAGRSAGQATVRWRAAEPAVQLQWQDLVLQDLALGPVARPAVAWRELRLHNGSADLATGQIDLGQIALARPAVNLARNPAGRWMWSEWLRPSPETEVSQAVAPAGPPWRVGWQGLRVTDGSGRLDDAATPSTVALRWSALQVQLGAWRSDTVADTPVSVAARIATDGQGAAPGSLSLDGRLGLRLATAVSPLEARLKTQLTLDRLPVHGLVPYLADRLNLALRQADTSWRGQLSINQDTSGLGVVASGDLTVDGLRAVDAQDGSPLLDWKTLNLRGVQVALAPGQPFKLKVADTALSDYFARIDIAPSGRVNLQDVLRTPADEARAPTPAGPPAQLDFGPVALVNGHVAFSDRFVRPNYSARLTELTGRLGAFNNQAGANSTPAEVSLRGRVEGSGTLDIAGQLNPLVTPPVLDITGKVRELELPPLSTYALKYTGHGIERGQLSVDVRYQVGVDGQLQASNQLTLNRLVFGERAPDSEAPNLPVKLAVALLADRQGVIDINLPISGSLNDPEFRLGPIIGRLILGLIGKAVTAPFALLGNLFGGADAQNGRIDFLPGTDRMAEAATPTLSAIVKALNDRPALQLTVVGHSDLAAEREAYQRERLQDAVRAEKRRQGLRAGQGSEAETAVSPEEYPALLREVYRRSEGPKPRNAIGMLKELTVPEMEALWLSQLPAPDDALRELATRRAAAVKARLVADGLAGARVFVELGKGDAQGPGARADLRLSLP